MEEIKYQPIGYFYCQGKSPVLAPRQGVLAPGRQGRIELGKRFPIEMLADLAGFDRIWVIFHFHQSVGYSAKVKPPHRNTSRGLFATRAPRRPNAIGMSAVRLLQIKGRTLEVSEHDLLDGTPVLDIKPYLAYADAFPKARAGWVDEERKEECRYQVLWNKEAACRRNILSGLYGLDIALLISDQLSLSPEGHKRKRIARDGSVQNGFVFSWRTWRFRYVIRKSGKSGQLEVTDVFNAVLPEDKSEQPDADERCAFYQQIAGR